MGVFRLKGQPKRDSGSIVRSCKASQSPVYPIRDAFAAVYDSAVERRLDEDDWNKLKRVLPGPRRVIRRLIRGDGSGRDRALRRAVVEAFGQKGWPIENFLEAVTDMAVLSSVATENLRTKPGKVLRRRLNAKIKRGYLVLSGPQRTALNSWIDS